MKAKHLEAGAKSQEQRGLVLGGIRPSSFKRGGEL